MSASIADLPWSFADGGKRRVKASCVFCIALAGMLQQLPAVAIAPEKPIARGRRGVFSPDGAKIAFEAVRNGRLSVGIVSAEGGSVTWISPESGFAGFPAWASGNSVIYTCSLASNTTFEAVRRTPPDDGANLWLWKDGENRQLTRGRVFDYGASVAPDGTIWFVTTRGEEKADFRNNGMCKSHIARLSHGEGRISVLSRFAKSNSGFGMPSVSSDGKHLLWSEVRGLRGSWRIAACPASGLSRSAEANGELTYLTVADAVCHSPRWSHDGRKICYTGYYPGDPGWCVYEHSVADGRKRRVCAGENPCFSPDGNHILYDRDGMLYVRTVSEEERKRPVFEKIAQVDHWDFGGRFDTESSEGVRGIIDHVMRTGPDTLAWRVNGGSMPRFSGKEERIEDLAAPFNPVRIPDGRDLAGHSRLFGGGAGIDSVRAAGSECARRGLRFCAYWPYEENHHFSSKIGGWNLSHPEFWCARTNGVPWVGRCSAAYPEVVAHKMRILDDILATEPDTLYIEAWRTGGWTVRDEYVQPNIDVWKSRYPGEALPAHGDPRWIALVAESQYRFFREVRRRLDASGRKIRFLFGIYCRHGEESPMYVEKGIDWKRLAGEGIIDGVVIMGFDPDPQRPLESTRELYRSVAKDKGGCQLFCPVSEYCQSRKRGIADYAKMLGVSNGEATKILLDLAREVNADGILMECVDYGNYTDEMRKALNDSAK